MSKTSRIIAKKQVYCDTCNCYIPSSSLVESHNKGRKHQRLWNMIQKKEKLSRCSVFVRGFRKDSDIENDLELVFSKFGSIADVYVDKEKCSYAIVQFEEEHAVADLLQSKHNLSINGHKLVVKPRKQKENEPKLQNKDTNVVFESKYAELCADERLINCKSISEQMEKLVEVMQLTAEDLELRRKLCEFLEEIFKEIYNNCRVLPFGSTTTGLGCHGCDLDLTLLTEDLSTYESTRQHHNLEDWNSNQEGLGGKTDIAMKSHRELTEVCEVLRKFAPGCKNVFPLSGTHCPLVKFEHKDSSLHCDLSINNRLAVRNSELLSSYCTFDIRFRYLSYAIRSWATAKAIAGRGAFQLTKYTWSIMLVHYLQHCDPPVLPCLQKEKTGINDHCFIEGWDCYFDAEPEKSAERQNSLSLGQLLAGFLHYFMNFNWKSDVVSISIPMKQRKEDFSKHLEKIGKKDLFKVGAIWMPDPFELTHNIAHNMTKEGLENLINELEGALNVFVSNDIDCRNDVCFISSRPSNSKQELQNGADESSVSSANRKVEGGLILDSKTIGENKFEQTDLLNLLKPKETALHGKKRNHPKVKFVFDVYGFSYESPTVVCRRCARVALKILKHDLNIQCSYEVEAKQNVNPSSTSVSQGSIADCISHSGVSAMLCQKGVSVPKYPEVESGNMEASLKESDKRLENEENIKNHKGQESSGNSELDLEKNKSKLSELKATTPMKRLGSRDISESPRKVQRLMKESDGGMGDFTELDFDATFESVALTIAAWENTWKNRRQHRRMINSGKESTTVKTKDVGVEKVEVPSQSSETSPSYEQNVLDNSFMSLDPVAEKYLEKHLESSLSSSVFDSDLQPKSKGTLACDTVPGKPVFLAEIRFTVTERSVSNPKCRIIVKLIETEKLSEFHTFFAFFKKTILQEMKP